jgi:acyl-CoA thioester hydrolase
MDTFPTVEHTFRVRYAETDQMGVVHNAVYLVWFEIGRTEYCIERGFPYSRIEEEGAVLVVAESVVRYKKPAHYDDLVTVRTTISRMKPKVVTFSYQVLQHSTGDLIAEGETVHVALSKETGRPTRMSALCLEKLGPTAE